MDLCTFKRANVSGWFFGAAPTEIYRGNAEEWVAWSFFHCRPDEIGPQDKPTMDHLVDMLADWAEISPLPPGHNSAVRAMKMSLDDVKSQYRPLIYYLVTSTFIDFTTILLMRYYGFSSHSSGNMNYWRRGGNGTGHQQPLVFCHGLGIGVMPYVSFIQDLVARQPDRACYLIELPNIAMRVQSSCPSASEICVCIEDMLAAWGDKKAHFMGHSFGTVVVTWLIRRYSTNLVTSCCLIDPVPFLLCKADLCYSFLYKPPQTAVDVLLDYFVSKELYIAHSLSRSFIWHENILFVKDLIDIPSVVVLAGRDPIIPTHSVRCYLESAQKATPDLDLTLKWFNRHCHASFLLDESAQKEIWDTAIGMMDRLETQQSNSLTY